MRATILKHPSTDTYTLRVYHGVIEVFSEWCGSYATAERLARERGAKITNIELQEGVA